MYCVQQQHSNHGFSGGKLFVSFLQSGIPAALVFFRRVFVANLLELGEQRKHATFFSDVVECSLPYILS
jgi:hypothetical protein